MVHCVYTVAFVTVIRNKRIIIIQTKYFLYRGSTKIVRAAISF